MSILKSIQTICLFLLFYFCYSYVVYIQKSEFVNSDEIISPLAQKGRLVFQKYNCISCHQLYGLGGYLGPDLTNVISSKGSHYVSAILENGMLKMPKLDITDDEIKALIEYLSYTDSSGVYPVKDFEIEWYSIATQKKD